MDYVGLDLSITSTGIGIISNNDCHGISVKRVSRLEPQFINVASMALRVMESLKSYKESSAVAVEGYAFGIRSRSQSSLMELGGIVRFNLHKKKIPFVIVPPTLLKHRLGVKGNAKKPEVVSAYNSLFDTDFEEEDNDIVDALILARMCREWQKGRAEWIDKCEVVCG